MKNFGSSGPRASDKFQRQIAHNKQWMLLLSVPFSALVFLGSSRQLDREAKQWTQVKRSSLGWRSLWWQSSQRMGCALQMRGCRVMDGIWELVIPVGRDFGWWTLKQVHTPCVEQRNVSLGENPANSPPPHTSAYGYLRTFG